MQGQIGAIITVSCISAFLMPLFKQGSKMSAYASFAVGCVCVYAVFSPLMLLVRGFGRLDDHDYDKTTDEYVFSMKTEEWIMEETDSELRRSIAELLRMRFSIPVTDEMITLYYDSSDYDKVVILKAVIDMTGMMVIKDVSEVRQYASELLLCDCEVVIE